MKQRILCGLFGAIATVALSVPTSVVAATTTLKFAMPGAPHDEHYEKVLLPWAKKVEADSKGTVKIEFFVGPRLANFRNLPDRLLSGVVDIGFGLIGPTGLPFPRTDVVHLPLSISDPAQSAPALWTMYQTGLISEEYQRWKVLGLFAFPSIQIHGTVPLRTRDDLKGHKFAVTSKVLANTLTRLGGTPVSMAPPDQYQAISNGVLQGNVMPWTGIDDFKIYEVTKHHLITNLGIVAAYVFMSKAAYDKLPPEGKKAINQNSGLSLSSALGKNTSEHGIHSAEKIGALPGQTINKLSAAQQAEWNKVLQPVIDNWVKATPNGAKILATYKDLIAKYKAGK